MLSRSIVDDSWSVIHNSRVILQLWASFTIIIYDHQIFIVKANGGISTALSLVKNDTWNFFVKKPYGYAFTLTSGCSCARHPQCCLAGLSSG